MQIAHHLIGGCIQHVQIFKTEHPHYFGSSVVTTAVGHQGQCERCTQGRYYDIAIIAVLKTGLDRLVEKVEFKIYFTVKTRLLFGCQFYCVSRRNIAYNRITILLNGCRIVACVFVTGHHGEQRGAYKNISRFHIFTTLIGLYLSFTY